MLVHLNIGSNLGDREAILYRAVELLGRALPGRVTCSRMIETPAWGFESQHPFLNMGVTIGLERVWEPLELLHTVQRVQHEVDPSPHRDDKGGYIDRAIDIDIIAIDDTVMMSSELTLPHPRMHMREFVLRPMAEIAPEWVHPLLHMTAAQMLVSMGE